MFGSAVVNQRQHVGLQELSALAGATRSCLGPSKNYKFIQDETSGESTLVCSCFRLLENLDLSCAVGQLVNETVQSHQKVYRSGSGSLLFLAGAWSRAALECLQRGISIAHIISAMSEGMDICLDVCRKYSVATSALCASPSENCSATCQVLERELLKKPAGRALQVSSLTRETPEVSHKTRNTSGRQRVKLTHSRHFYEAKSEKVSTVPRPHSQDSKDVDITHIAGAVSHGCDDSMSLVVEASRLQTENGEQDFSRCTFDITKVVTCILPGLPEERACVLPGCVVLLSAEQASVALHVKDQRLKVALINGDLSETYRHLGFNRPAGVRQVTSMSGLGSLSKEEEWLESVLTSLLKLSVNLILVSGVACEKLIQRCYTHHILVVEKVRASILRAFADATGAVPVTYATQLSKHCVGSGVQAAVWRDLSSQEKKSSVAVNISTNNNTGLVTVILTSCIHGKLQALEDQFWACAYRLHHALKDKALLPGAGEIEMLCVHHLKKRAQHHVKPSRESGEQANAGRAASPYRHVVLHLMADGFIDYISTVMVNTGRCTKVKAWTALSQQLQNSNAASNFSTKALLESETQGGTMSPDMKSNETAAGKVYDNFNVKVELWRKALDLVFLVLQTDAEIITGVDHKTVGTQSANLMLL
ncbi:chaperonin-containing T-complex member BBS12 isoform X2 [Myripristis murdjan]|nr:Bardet-Biedl syndrome 12 protein isoform X2 [Myripristis murdjan]